MERVSNEGAESLAKAVRDDPAEFVKAQMERVTADANNMYLEFRPNAKLPESVIQEILGELANRLRKAGAGPFIPKIGYSSIGFSLAGESEWVSRWGQALRFLHGVIEFPRKVMTDPYALRGLRLKEEEVLEAMDVCGDYIVPLWRQTERSARNAAEFELRLLKEIMELECDARAKCEAILLMIRGEPLLAPTLKNRLPAAIGG